MICGKSVSMTDFHKAKFCLSKLVITTNPVKTLICFKQISIHTISVFR